MPEDCYYTDPFEDSRKIFDEACSLMKLSIRIDDMREELDRYYETMSTWITKMDTYLTQFDYRAFTALEENLPKKLDKSASADYPPGVEPVSHIVKVMESHIKDMKTTVTDVSTVVPHVLRVLTIMGGLQGSNPGAKFKPRSSRRKASN